MHTHWSRSNLPRRVVATLIAMTALLAQTAGATTFSVDTTVDLPDGDILDGICSWMADPVGTAPTCSLRAAIMQANATPVDDAHSAVTIHLLANADYPLTQAPTANDVLGGDGDLDVFRPIAIGVVGVFEPARATIAIAEHVERAFHFKPGAAGSSVFGLRLHREYLEEEDGGLACVLLAEKDTGALALDRIEVYDTPCMQLGTMVFRSGVTATVRDSEFHHGNRALYVSGGSLTLERSSIHSNFVGDTGATTVAAGTNAVLTISHSTFVDNPVHVGASNANVSIVSSTLANVTGDTGSVWIDSNAPTALLHIQNSIFLPGNVPSCAFSTPVHGHVNISGSVFDDASCVPDDAPAAPNLNNATVQLGPLSNSGGLTPTMELLPDSDGVDWIAPQFCNPGGTDQRGFPRAVDYSGLQPAHCDAGATELQTQPPLPEGHIFGDGFEDD